jgi:hypothetical protein
LFLSRIQFKMVAAIYNFKKHQTGSTFEAVSFMLEVNAARKSLSGALIEMVLTCLTKTYTFSTATGEFTITDADRGEFRLNKQIIDLPAGNYHHTMTITFNDGTVKQYVKGSWKII